MNYWNTPKLFIKLNGSNIKNIKSPNPLDLNTSVTLSSIDLRLLFALFIQVFTLHRRVCGLFSGSDEKIFLDLLPI